MWLCLRFRILLATHSNLSAPCLSGGHCQLRCLPDYSLNIWNDLANPNHTHTHTQIQVIVISYFFSSHAGLGIPLPGYKRIASDPEELPGLVPSTAPKVLGTVVRQEESEDQNREAGPSWDRIASYRRTQTAQGQAWHPMEVVSTCQRADDLSIVLPLLPTSILQSISTLLKCWYSLFCGCCACQTIRYT